MCSLSVKTDYCYFEELLKTTKKEENVGELRTGHQDIGSRALGRKILVP